MVTVYVPSVRITGGKFSTTYHPVKSANVKLSGRFTSASRVKGTVVGSGYACDYTIGFVAHQLGVPVDARSFTALGTALPDGTALPPPQGVFPRYVPPGA